jgi:glycine/D-amino acid oxidase-like deaminating enzyme
VNIAIVGAGIAGLSIGQFLSSTNNQITIIDSKNRVMGSNAPTILFHPFPGRSLEAHPLLPNAVTETVTLLNIWRELAHHLIRPTMMIRPISGSNNHRLLNSYNKHWSINQRDWTSVRRLNRNQLIAREPILFSNQLFNDAIGYQPAVAIDFRELKKRILNDLCSKGVQYIQTSVSSLEHFKNWHFPEVSASFDKVIFAIGLGAADWFPGLKITNQGGSLLKAKAPFPISNLLSLNGLHLGSHHDGDLVVGSTRWSIPPSDELQIEELTTRIKTTFPTITSLSPSELWSGIRCIYPADRLPLCGELPHYPGVYVLTALGSKGMLWGPIAARQIASHLLDKTPIAPLLSLQRAKAMDAWFSSRITI